MVSVPGYQREMSLKITIKRATAADVDNLVRVQILAFHHDAKLYPGVEIGGPPGYDSVEKMREKIDVDECYTIFADKTAIGGIVVYVMEEGHYHLDLIFIDPAYHNKGIGSQAMQFLETTYPAKRWTLDTPKYAIRNQHFYEKFGYVKVREFESDIPLIAYEKLITGGE